MVMGGISRQSAAATILVGGCCCFGPSGGNNLLAADLTKMHVMDFFLNVQWTIGWVAVIAMLVAHFFIQRWFDKRDLAKGILTKEDFEVPQLTKEERQSRKRSALVRTLPADPGYPPVRLLSADVQRHPHGSCDCPAGLHFRCPHP